jgi:C4-dicarboxylate-specific signal transduction histidine kinase
LASELHAIKTAENYTVRIVDNGCGISQEDLKNIHKPHFTTKADKGGTGLGIPRAIQISEVLNAELSINSEQGNGTEAVLVFKKVDGELNHG